MVRSQNLKNSAKKIAQYAHEWVRHPISEGLSIHNLNFPFTYDGKHEPILSFAGSLRLGSLFSKVEGEDYHQLNIDQNGWIKKIQKSDRTYGCWSKEKLQCRD